MFKLPLEKAEDPEIKLSPSVGSLKKRESYRKTSTSALLTMPKPCLTQWNYELCCVGPPKTDVSWWRVLTKHGPLEKGITNHFSILALRTPRTVWTVWNCVSSVQSLSRVRLFATPWIAACQASLSITKSQSSLRLTYIESVMPSREAHNI